MRRLVAALCSLAAGMVAVGGGAARANSPSVSAVSSSAAPPTTSATSGPAPAPVTVEPQAKAPATVTIPAATNKAPARAKKRRKKIAPPLPLPAAQLVAINTHESFTLRPDPKGRITHTQLRGWNRFLRCHHTGRVHAMSTRLAELIYAVDKHFDFKTVFVVAGYRAPRIAREKGNPKSPHKKGVACDFRIDGVPNSDLRDFERTLPRVGVGYYPNSEFVHLDVDPLRNKHSAFWIDYSRPGERAKYSKNPSADLDEERSGEGEPTLPDAVTNSAAVPALGGEEPQASPSKGALNPNSPPPIFPLPENH